MFNRKKFLSDIEDLDDLKKVWRNNGMYFGYPICCISEFLECNEFSEDQLKVRKYGFVPCISCTKRILNGLTTIEDLIQNRVCKTNYPIHNKDSI